MKVIDLEKLIGIFKFNDDDKLIQMTFDRIKEEGLTEELRCDLHYSYLDVNLQLFAFERGKDESDAHECASECVYNTLHDGSPYMATELAGFWAEGINYKLEHNSPEDVLKDTTLVKFSEIIKDI